MKKDLGHRECSRESNARNCNRSLRNERSALLRVSPTTIAAGHTVDIWHRHAIALILSGQSIRVQRGRIPLSEIAGTVHGRCNLEKNIVKFERNAKT